MTTLTQDPSIGAGSCPSCGFAIDPGKSFCPRCGHSHRADQEPKSEKSPKLGNLASAQHGSEIRGARIAIMVVAILTLIVATVQWNLLTAEINKIRANPVMVVDESVVSEARLILGAVFAVGFLFIGLFFWAKRNPFAATLTALVIYLGNWLITAVIDPTYIMKGIIVKLIIVGCLVKGVQAAIAHKALDEFRANRDG